jgi:PAS domain S-box-containing protein
MVLEITFGENDFIVSKTDMDGRITYGNSHFIEISGYGENELISRPHNILRHPDMPSVVFKLLWENIAKGEEIFAYVKNLNKHGDYYWVFAHVTPSFDVNGRIIGYHSVRRKPKSSAVAIVDTLYKTLFEQEKQGGVRVSEALLNETLKQKGFSSYAEFILSI